MILQGLDIWLINLINQIAPWIITIIVILLLICGIIDPDRLEKWKSLIARSLSWIWGTGEKIHVASDIKSEVNRFAKMIDKESPGILPYGLKVEWVKDKSREAFLRDGEIVVLMEHHKNQAKNFVAATMTYLNLALLPTTRHYIDRDVMKASDYTVAKKLFVTRGRADALLYFNSELLEPEVLKNPTIQRFCITLENLDTRGILTKVLFTELLDMGNRLAPRTPSANILQETRDFVISLEKLGEKEKGVDVNPSFEGQEIRAAVVLVARSGVVEEFGFSPHLKFINSCIENNYKTIYLLAAGRTNVEFARVLATQLEQRNRLKKGVECSDLIVLHGDTMKSICIQFHILPQSEGE